MRQLNEISARIELESRIRDGARNMLQILEGQQGKGELRSQIQHELDMAEEHMNTLSERRMVLQAKMKESLTSVPYLRPRAIRAVHGLDDLNAPSGERHTPSSSAPLVLPESHVFLMPEVHNIGSLKQDSQPLVKAMALILERWMTGDIRILASEWADVLNTASSLFQMVPQLKNMIDTRVLMLSSSISLFLSRALSQEERCSFEREQALKLIRALMGCHRYTSSYASALITEGCVRALAAVAWEPEDALYHASVETLTELARSSGFSPLWCAVCEARSDLAVPLVTNFLSLLDRPATRRYISPGTDLEGVLAGFSTVPMPKTDVQNQRLQTTGHVMPLLLRSWTGLFYLCQREGGALKTLVATLRVQDDAIRHSALATVDSLVQLVAPSPEPAVFQHQAPYLSTSLFREQYVALVLALLLDVGLIEALVSIVKLSPEARDYASDILARILRFAYRALPDEQMATHAFPELLHHLCLPEEPSVMVDAAGALQAIEKASAQYEKISKRTVHGTISWDETYFRTLIRDSMLVTSKDFSAWNVAMVEELLDGPLHDPRRFEEALTSTKLIRRLLSFFRPSNLRFAALNQDEMGCRWAHMGVKLVRLLLHHPEGVRLFAEDRFLMELREAFEQLEQMSSDMLFSPSNLKRTMVSGYFDMLGALSEQAQGLEVLDHARLFSTWMKLCELDTEASSRVLEALIDALDVTSPSHARMFLERALTKAPTTVRMAATEQVARSLWLDGEAQGWAMSLLLAQLHDVAQSVRALAEVRIRAACQHPTMAHCAMAQGPPLDLLMAKDTFALHCLAVPLGFQTMLRQGLLAPLAHAWHRQEHMAYVPRVEQAVAPDQSLSPIPPHLYGQLARTDAGCQYLQELRMLPEWVSLLRGDQFEAYDAHMLHQIKAALWACGHMGASDLGVPLLEAHGLLDALMAASLSPVVSIRGTSFYACALVSQSARGREALAARHWTTRGLCLPVHRWTFVQLNESQIFVGDAFASRLVPAEDKSERDAAMLLAKLGNGVVAGQARRALLRMHEQEPLLFQRLSLLGRALHLMDHFPLHLAARRTIWALMGQCDISLETVTALQRWRSAHVAVAPAVPKRRAPRAQPSQASDQEPRLYDLPSFRSLRERAGEARPMAFYARPSADPAQPPSGAGIGSTSRQEWPLQLRGFV